MVALLFLLPLPPLAAGVDYPMVLPYDGHQALHVLGAVLFVGNILVTGAWFVVAERSREPVVLEFAARATNWMDVAFTAPGALLVMFNGLVMSVQWGGVLGQSWLTAGFGLFGASGVVWAALLIPAQHRLIRGAGTGLARGQMPPEFFRELHRWYLWGIVATVLPVATLFLMVAKPALW